MWGGDAADSGVRLSFDSFEQNDALVVSHSDVAGERSSAVEFVDRPRWSLVDLVTELTAAATPEAEQQTLAGYLGRGGNARRLRLARESDGSVGLDLCDAEGRPRLRFRVGANGETRAERLDDDGVATSLLG